MVTLSIVASGGGILFGYDIGIVSGALEQLSTQFHLSCRNQEMVVSSMLFGALCGSLVGGYFIDRCGRKISIILSCILYFVGGIILCAAQSYNNIIGGRIVLGIAMALASSSECVYVSELAPQAIRGSLVSLNEVGITIGIMVSYLINLAFANKVDGWRYMFGLSTVVAGIVFVCILFLPRSPRYLLMKQKDDLALSALLSIRLQNTENQKRFVMQEFEVMQNNLNEVAKCSKVCDRSLLYPIIIAAGLVILQQSTGEPNVLYYANSILVGMGFENESVVGTVSLGVAKVLATFVCLLLVDKLGRRKFLLIGCFIMFLSIFSLSIMIFKHNIENKRICNDNITNISLGDIQNITTPSFSFTSSNHSVSKWLAVVLLIMFVAAYSISFGPVTWIVLSEIFPKELRGRLFSFAASLNWAVNLIISSTFLGFVEVSGGLGWPFMVNAMFGVCSLAFVYFVVPETKGKSLEEVNNTLKHGIACNHQPCMGTHKCFCLANVSDTAPLIEESM